MRQTQIKLARTLRFWLFLSSHKSEMKGFAIVAVAVVVLAVALQTVVLRPSLGQQARNALQTLKEPPPELAAPGWALQIAEAGLAVLDQLGVAVKPAPLRAFEALFGFGLTQGLAALARMEVFDGLAEAAENGTTCEELVVFMRKRDRDRRPIPIRRLPVDPELLCRLLDFAAANQFVNKDQDTGRFYLNEFSVLFTQGADNLASVAPMLFHNADEINLGWTRLHDGIRDKLSAFELANGDDVWSFYDKNPEKSANFNLAMRSISANFAPALLLGYADDFKEFVRQYKRPLHLCDVGGGIGSVAAGILSDFPNATATVIDMAHMETQANEYFEQVHLQDRIKFVPGNFFQPLAVECDYYLLKHIIHDWNDTSSLDILKAVRANMPSHSKLLLVETVMETRNPYFERLKRFVDMQMLVVFRDAKERTQHEFNALLEFSRFQMKRRIPLRGLFDIVEAIPVETSGNQQS
ncbi:hypothetical protein CAOG_07573 [Capsaspora owczarzaki ATCC 30864]|uniref:O-methyltransferase C-terminal domain-containing protein n=1 Tax=Capsaspora owczarzaki (strain ATCC 30864) TaxID=595528 RepID=A0A0D2WWW5_CAPO3|nr:hypothetical protein CAOG_07573 [Capsaspora owczarzaki ATCC 30864]KJE97103.1 hypothetical protein CAOG_007573 [Capsaspora owczarzaki ATCC 30864]|eukprot:XP_004343447.1 hypothetical protein CAOG_07573 [Capsaspora owczarzaki ATCC 30864]